MKPDTSPGHGYGLPSLSLYEKQTLLNSGTAYPRLHTNNKRHKQTNIKYEIEINLNSEQKAEKCKDSMDERTGRK